MNDDVIYLPHPTENWYSCDPALSTNFASAGPSASLRHICLRIRSPLSCNVKTQPTTDLHAAAGASTDGRCGGGNEVAPPEGAHASNIALPLYAYILTALSLLGACNTAMSCGTAALRPFVELISLRSFLQASHTQLLGSRGFAAAGSDRPFRRSRAAADSEPERLPEFDPSYRRAAVKASHAVLQRRLHLRRLRPWRSPTGALVCFSSPAGPPQRSYGQPPSTKNDVSVRCCCREAGCAPALARDLPAARALPVQLQSGWSMR